MVQDGMYLSKCYMCVYTNPNTIHSSTKNMFNNGAFLINALNQSMQVLKWLECLMFILISQWLRSWGLSIVNFTDSWDFVVVRSFLSSRWSVLLSFWRQKGYPFKVLLKRTRGLVLKEKFLFGVSAFGIFSEWFCFGSCKWGASCKPTCF